MAEEDTVLIYTDGACSGNPGPGGWAAVLRYRGHKKKISGWSSNTTNNRMELLAAIRALETLKRPCQVELVTDSQYLRKGISEWIYKWKKNGWRTGARKPVKNKDLWTRLDSLCQRHQVHWKWVRGHAGNTENEEVDAMAREAIEKGQAGELFEDPDGKVI